MSEQMVDYDTWWMQVAYAHGLEKTLQEIYDHIGNGRNGEALRLIETVIPIDFKDRYREDEEATENSNARF